MMPPQPPQYLSEKTAKEMLDEFVLHHDPYSVDIIPKRVDPHYADKYLRENVTADVEPFVFWQTRRVVDFYDLKQTLGHIKTFLDKKEKASEHFNRSVAAVMMMAETGDSKDWKFVEEYFQTHLLKHSSAKQHLPLLLQCWTALGPDSKIDDFEKFFEQQVQALEKGRKKNDDAEMAYQRLRAVYVNDLPRAKRALAAREEIERLRGDAQLRAIIDNYARLDRHPAEYLHNWSARMLRAAATTEKGKTRLLELLRERVAGIEQDKTLGGDLQRFAKTRLVRAVEYFDADVLTLEEQEYLEDQLSRGQDDLLSTIQPQPVYE